MPIVKDSAYKRRPWHYFNAHLETILPSMMNKVEGVNYKRERLELVDGDFLDLDWIRNQNKRLIIISHGMEGSSTRHYVLRSAKYFNERGWDILAWNNRSCSGEMNRLAKLYHHGETEDLSAVVTRALRDDYNEIVLIGISMGGCQTVKYFGSHKIDKRVIGGFGVSVSFNMEDTSLAADQRLFGLYGRIFLNQLKDKYKEKAQVHRELKDIDIDSISSFDEMHDQITTVLFGFESKEAFYKNASSVNYLEDIQKPVFALNAKNDPLLGDRCYPIDPIKGHPYVYAEYPQIGGHVGFTIPGKEYSYVELCADRFIEEVIYPSLQTSAPRR